MYDEDGSIDYSLYSLKQLYEAKSSINKDKYPKNYEALIEQIALRKIEAGNKGLSEGTGEKTLVQILRLPIGLAAANYICWAILGVFPSLTVSVTASIAFILFRIGLIFWSGFLVTNKGVAGLPGAALGGLSILVVDHIILKGGWFLILHFGGYSTDQLSYLSAFGGVLVSFVMFGWVAAAIGVIGGLVGRQQRVQSTA